MASATSHLDRDPWIEDLNATSSLSYLSKLLSTLFPGGASLNAAGPISFLIVAGLSIRLLSQMSGEHIRNEYGSSRCTKKEARLLAILTSRVTVWGIDYVAESPIKELSYVHVLDVSLIPRNG
ncbi:hypothetical protein Tco_1297197 [Tanacetum coccineum]